MDPLSDYPLRTGPAAPVPPRRDRRLIGAALVVVLLVLAAAGFYLWRRAVPAPPASAPAAVEAGAPDVVRRPLGPPVETGPLPPLDELDPLVRQLLGALSSHPQVVAWLATDGLVREFVASLDNVAGGASPAGHVRRLAPSSPFEVQTRSGRTTISQRSFDRYNALADAVSSLDPAGLASVYARLKPRLQEAYVELGHPGGDIDAAVEQAIVRLLATPVPGSDVAVEPGIESYKFREGRLESLSPAQKQLVRMGPRNVRIIQAQLWALGRELGIPSERLPAPAM